MPFVDNLTAQPQHEESGGLSGKTIFLTELLMNRLPHLPAFLIELQCALEDTYIDLEKVCSALRAHPLVYTLIPFTHPKLPHLTARNIADESSRLAGIYNAM